MSKSKKKKQFSTISIDWQTEESALPTHASAFDQRGRGRGRGGYGGNRGGGRGGGGFGSGGGGYGGGRSGFGNYNNNNDDKPDRSDAARWRSNKQQPTLQSSSGGYNNRSSFGSFRNNDRNSYQSPGGGGFNRNGPPRNDSQTSSEFGASDNDNDWRRNKKPKEQPKISLNSTISHSNNPNPWSNGGGGGDLSRSAFGSKQQSPQSNMGSFNRNAFGSKQNDSYTPRTGGFGPRGGNSKFGGGGGSKFGASSTSKFNTGGGFGAAALKNIDTGKARLSYAKNNRFAAILDDPDPPMNTNSNSVSLQLPSKVQNNRFSSLNSSAQQSPNGTATKKREQTPPKREKTTSELQKEWNDKIRRDKALKAAENKENENNDNKNKKNSKKQKNKSSKAQNNNNKESINNKPQKSDKEKEIERQKKELQKQKKRQAMDNKMIKKFNKDCLREKKPIEINKDTERFIYCGLSQKDNVLTRYEENYEKIANMLCLVLLNKKNLKSDNVITLSTVYDIIYNKSKLKETKTEFIALCLEIMSVIENSKSPLYLVSNLSNEDICNKYLCQTPDIRTDEVIQEFVEYGLQYAYPLSTDYIKEINDLCASQCSMNDLFSFLSKSKSNHKIYGNYESIQIVLNYVLNTFYFGKCNVDEQKDENAQKENENLAKMLCTSSQNKDNEKTDFVKIIELLHHKNEDEDEEEEEEEDEEDEVVSHSMLIISNVISISSELNNSNVGLLAILKAMESARLISYNAIQRFVQCDNDKYTKNRLNALSKLTDWIANLDARQARIMMERDAEQGDDEEDDGMANDYAGNLLAPRKHKGAADYETISYVPVE